MNRVSLRQGNEEAEVHRGDVVAVPAGDSRRGSRVRPARWLRMRIEDEGEKVLSITVPWFLCGWLLTLASWTLRFVPSEANESIEKQVPGGMRAIRVFLSEVRRMPAGARIEVASGDSDYVLIECR